jgi:osmotically-inducible protein OsmY
MTTTTMPEDGHSTGIPQAEARTAAEALAFSGSGALENDVASVLASALGTIAATFRVSVQGHRIILRGTAPSYAEKARAEHCLRAAGYHEVDNCLRVVPSINLIP